MSSIYVLEPPTAGKVVMKTSMGDIDVEFWPKEAPKAVRNFFQLAIDGFYHATIFHRVLKGFMVQGGDPTGTGKGGVSIYGDPFPDEFHSRLKFNHRGIVACANEGRANSNTSQFFFTLDRCDWLDKKHTIFGKITGDTIFNALKIGEVDTGPGDRPTDPPSIVRIEVLWNPFDDMVPRVLKRTKDGGDGREETKEAAAGKQQQAAKKQLNLLSFGDEAEEEESELQLIKQQTKKKIVSSHDVLDDARLLKEDARQLHAGPDVSAVRMKLRGRMAEEERRIDEENPRRGESGGSRVEAEERRKRGEESSSGEEDVGGESAFDAQMRREIMERRKRAEGGQQGASVVASTTSISGKKKKTKSSEKVKEQQPVGSSGDVDESSDDEKPSSHRKPASKSAPAVGKLVLKQARDSAAIGDEGRGAVRLAKKAAAQREQKTLEILQRFKSKLSSSRKTATPLSGGGDLGDEGFGGKEEEEGETWMSHRLKFEVEKRKQDEMDKRNDPRDYIVFDPLLEKGKEKFFKADQKRRKQDREWAGKSLD